MKDHDFVIGLTLAELAFFLLFAIVFVVAVRENISPEEHKALQQQVTDLEKEKQEFQQQVTDLEARVAELESLQSSARPHCSEARLINADGAIYDFLFNVTIVGRDTYFLLYPYGDGEMRTLEGILARYESDLAAAEQAQCVHRIGVHRMPDLELDDYLDALTMLDKSFYTARRR